MRFVTQQIHAWLDYPVAIGLIAMPLLLGVGSTNPAAMWLSLVTGVAALILTLLTDHQTGVIRIIPYRFHLAVDFIVGIVFLLAPHILGFTGLDFWYYTVLAVTVLAVVSLHKPETNGFAPAQI